MSRPSVTRGPARPCAMLRRNAQTTRMVEAAGIEPAPIRAVTDHDHGPCRPGEESKKLGRQPPDLPANERELVPLTRDEANAFIRAHHRHCRRVQSHRGAIGCEVGGRLVGVAILANPPSRSLAKRDRFLCELVRVCVAPDAPRNTCSWLYARARRAAAALGFRRVTTTTLATESGASLRGAGFEETARMPARKGWDSASRPRETLPTDGQAKVRWEASA